MTNEEKIQTEAAATIELYARKFDHFNDTDTDYIPPELARLRNYIFQGHAVYELALFVIIGQKLLSDSITVEKAEDLLSKLTFEEKLKMVALEEPTFPVKSARKINSLRNMFAHKRGRNLRSTFNSNSKILRKYKSLSKYQDDIDLFWVSLPSTGVTATEGRSYIDRRNKKYKTD